MNAQAPAVAGHALSGGTYLISSDDNRALCRSVGIEPAADGSAHPIFFYIATQVGMGETVADLCAICDFDVNNGPLLGGCNVEFSQPLKVGKTYTVSGEILSLTRKSSKKLCIMDLLEYRLALSDEDQAVLSVINNWILPRGIQA